MTRNPLRARRDAARRMPTLESGTRDPLDDVQLPELRALRVANRSAQITFNLRITGWLPWEITAKYGPLTAAERDHANACWRAARQREAA